MNRVVENQKSKNLIDFKCYRFVRFCMFAIDSLCEYTKSGKDVVLEIN